MLSCFSEEVLIVSVMAAQQLSFEALNQKLVKACHARVFMHLL